MEQKSVIGKVRATFVELYSRYIKLDGNKDDSIYYNGANNLYPNEIELVILDSPSGKQSSKVFATYIQGKGVEGVDEIVNPDKNYTKHDLVKMSSTDIARQGGVFYHIGYEVSNELELKPVLDVLTYKECRIGKGDADDNEGKFWFKDCSKKSLFGKKDDAEWFYPHSKNKDVILAQIKSDYKEKGGEDEEATISDMLPYYRGQVSYLNMTPEFKYSLSPYDAVYNDLDSESRMSVYTNRNIRTGFLGKTCVVTSGLDTEDIEKQDEHIKKWLGDENVGGVYTVHLDRNQDLDKIFKVIQVKGDFDDKMFTENKQTIRKNIFGAANNMPEQFANSDTTMFGTNSATYIEMKKFYTEQTEAERSAIEKRITYLGYDCKIIPIIEIDVKNVESGTEQVNVSDETKTAQANLRGSVGGVQGVLGVQQSFSQGLTDYNSAITIFTEIYGFTLSVADALLGSPEKTDPNDTTTTTV